MGLLQKRCCSREHRAALEQAQSRGVVRYVAWIADPRAMQEVGRDNIWSSRSSISSPRPRSC